MKNGVHSLNLSKTSFRIRFQRKLISRFFQRMAIFTFYFTICLMGLLIRGYYRVPMSCIRNEIVDKDEKTMKSIIEDRMECRCHYTNFLWNKPMLLSDNQTIGNVTDDEHQAESWGSVRPLSLSHSHSIDM